MTAPAILVHADAELGDELTDAVVAAGGKIAAADEATAIVWASSDPHRSLRSLLSPGVDWVQLWDAGVEQWFGADVIDDRRTWTAAKGVYAQPIAEYVLAMMLAAARRLQQVLADRVWEPRDVRMIRGTTVGILGAGEVGSAVLDILTPFGVHTLAMTRTGRAVAGAAESLGPDSVDQILERSDYVVCCLPETPQTIGLLSRPRLFAMKPGAWLINVGRGSVVDTDALVEALEGRLGGAALDVTEPEPLPDGHPLWRLPNVSVTAHTACTALLGLQPLCDRVYANVVRYRCGEALLGVVDVGHGY